MQDREKLSPTILYPSCNQRSPRRGTIAATAARTAMIEMGQDPMIRMNDVEALTGLGASMIYQMMRSRTFPGSTPLTPNGRARGWRLSTITGWLTAREHEGTRVKR